MRINNNYSVQNPKYYNYNSVKANSFGAYNAIYPKTGQPATTSFYHDFPTLKKAVSTLEKFFPNGASVLVYAGSSGEEAISIYSMLKNPQKYDIYSIDPFKDAIEYAKKGIFKVKIEEESDGYLISGIKPQNAEQEETKNLFNKCFTRLNNPIYDCLNYIQSDVRDIIWHLSSVINDKNVLNSTEFFKLINMFPPSIIPILQQLNGEEFYKLNSDVQEQIHFVEGDIRNIVDFKTEKPVGGIFFRNALYHITNNFINDLGFFEYVDNETDRRKILSNLISSIEKKLDSNGIFVMGHHMQEHLYYADKYAPQDAILHCECVDYYKTPINVDALRDNGHFKDIYTRNIVDAVGEPNLREKYDEVMPFSTDIPLIWQKVL